MTVSKPSTPSKAKPTAAKRGSKVGESTPEVMVKVLASGIISPTGFSPRRLNQPMSLAMDKKDTYYIIAIRGGIIEIIYLDSKRNKANDGYFPFVTGLATDGNGEYKVCSFMVNYIAFLLPFSPLFYCLYRGRTKQEKTILINVTISWIWALATLSSVAKVCR
jgi:hypothetical protein